MFWWTAPWKEKTGLLQVSSFATLSDLEEHEADWMRLFRNIKPGKELSEDFTSSNNFCKHHFIEPVVLISDIF